MTLFQKKNFISHSGKSLTWKIECDVLTEEDWEGLVEIAIDRNIVPYYYSEIIGVPRGGLVFASKLQSRLKYNKTATLIIVDDVLTTGNSMEHARDNRPAFGLVAFSRMIRPYRPYWINTILEIA